MKRKLTYAQLWQKKRSQLPVKGNPDADWLQMRAALDLRMPVPAVINKPSRSGMPKWGLYVFGVISVIVAAYLYSYLHASKKPVERIVPPIRQIHHDVIVPVTKEASPASGTLKSAAGAGKRAPVEFKLNSDSIIKPGKQNMDSTNAPGILTVPTRRDSLLMPMQTAPHTPGRDSIAPVNLEKRVMHKDTAKPPKKIQNKKKRSKFSVFF